MTKKVNLNKDDLPEVSIREYLRNYKKYNALVKSGQGITLVSKREKIGNLLPEKSNKKYTIHDLVNLRFKGPKNLSIDIDKIVYGV